MTKRKQSQGGRHKTKPARSILGLAGIGLLLIIGAVITIFALNANKPSSGSARIEVTPEQIDFGDMQYDKQVTASFEVTNTGSDDLVFSKQPYIELKEGC